MFIMRGFIAMSKQNIFSKAWILIVVKIKYLIKINIAFLLKHLMINDTFSRLSEIRL